MNLINPNCKTLARIRLMIASIESDIASERSRMQKKMKRRILRPLYQGNAAGR